MKKEDLTKEAYEKALDVMHSNLTPKGFSATPERHANYYSVWARDHAITSIAAALTNDEKLIETAKKGIFFLLEKQSNHGQIPSYVEIENKKKVYGGLGSITSVDSNLWLVIAAALLYKKTKDKRFISDTNIKRFNRLYSLIKAFDSNDCGLIEVPLAGDWADIFYRSYHVLYDEVLYYQALKDLMFLFNEKTKNLNDKNKFGINKYIKNRITWLKKRIPLVKKKINNLFWFNEENIKKIFEEYMIVNEIEEKEYPYFQSHLVPFKMYWPQRFDSLGNFLAIVCNIADKEKSKKIIQHALNNKLNKPFPIKALSPPVYEHEKDWEPIYYTREKPHHYHNGAIWPMISGFWINALKKNKMLKQAKQELESLAQNLKKQDWTFNEYMHGKTTQPLGRNFQAWSAAGYIIAYHSVFSKSVLF